MFYKCVFVNQRIFMISSLLNIVIYMCIWNKNSSFTGFHFNLKILKNIDVQSWHWTKWLGKVKKRPQSVSREAALRLGHSCRVFVKYCVFSKILKYIPDSGLSRFSPRCQCVYKMTGQTPALQQNWQSSKKFLRHLLFNFAYNSLYTVVSVFFVCSLEI